jgi:hypothetical protein
MTSAELPKTPRANALDLATPASRLAAETSSKILGCSDCTDTGGVVGNTNAAAER